MAEFVPYEVNTGFFNMEKDAGILESAIDRGLKTPVLRFYGWEPACVSLGRNQSDGDVDLKFLAENNIDYVRRLTGGRALLHADELTYSFVSSVEYLGNQSVMLSYKEISGALMLGLKKFGVDVDFAENKPAAALGYCMSISSGADLSLNGKKLVGSAQFRRSGYLLQHGSILFSYDKEKIEKIFKEPFDDNKITCLRKICPEISLESLCDSLKFGFESYFNEKFMP